jgi:DNA processing protein
MLVERIDNKFPERLLGVKPEIGRLYYKGEWDGEIFQNCVAVVGSRRITDYGRRVVEKMVPCLVSAGVTVVSGFMYGVDQEAHRVCLASGGRTIAVLGWGIDWEVPNLDRKLFREILDNRGLIVSEYEGKREAERWMFVQRNRIVAGFSSAVLVVEGAMKSGSLVTARLARGQGRKVLAVPGPITSKVSEGTNWLIKKGLAVPVLGSDDLMREVGMGGGLIEKIAGGNDGVVLRALENEAMTVDRLAKVLGRRVEELMVELSEMELLGVVEQREGKFNKRQDNG